MNATNIWGPSKKAKTLGLPAEIARSQSGPFVAQGNKLPVLAVLSKAAGEA